MVMLGQPLLDLGELFGLALAGISEPLARLLRLDQGAGTVPSKEECPCEIEVRFYFLGLHTFVCLVNRQGAL